MVQKINLWQSTCPADENCVIYCQKLAEKLLGEKSSPSLVCVKTDDGTKHFVWADMTKQTDEPEFFPVFANAEKDGDIENIAEVKVMDEDEVFCHDDWVYCLLKVPEEGYFIRNVNILSTQKIVEQMVSYEQMGAPLEGIWLVHVYEIGKGKQYLATCWSIRWENGMQMYLPVFEEDESIFETKNIFSLFKEEVAVGSIFETRKKWFKVASDPKEGLYLLQADCCFEFNSGAKRSGLARIIALKREGG